VALGAVVFLTAQLRGGMGVRAFGGASIGGKGYYQIFAAIVGYFAFASMRVPVERAKFYAALFFLPSLIAAASNIIYWLGEPFYVLFAIFPVGFAIVQAGAEIGGSQISRVAGFGSAASACIFYLFSVNGMRGALTKWWRLLLVLVLIPIAAMGGFRTTIVLIVLVCLTLFLVEGLWRTSLLPIFLLIGLLGFAALIPLASRLPYPIQRSLSFVPGLKLDPMVKHHAQSSTEWRLLMWRALRPDLPKYFWLGKGYSLNASDIYLSEMAERRYRLPSYYGAMVVGNYHNGPLSVYIPFGVFGVLSFLAFLGASIRALYLNCRWGDPRLKTLNRFLLAYFVARVIFFIGAFGALASELYFFTGLIGMSVALNGGVCRQPAAALPAPVRLRTGFGSGAGTAEPHPA
jgi:O-antigen ligase